MNKSSLSKKIFYNIHVTVVEVKCELLKKQNPEFVIVGEN